MDDKKQQKPSLIGTEEILKKQNAPSDMENHIYIWSSYMQTLSRNIIISILRIIMAQWMFLTNSEQPMSLFPTSRIDKTETPKDKKTWYISA